MKFTPFWNRFETAIDSNEDIPKIEKFNYLYHYLEGAAARIVHGMQITEDNYDEAKEILKTRFGRPQLIITAHMDEIVKLRPCTGENPNQLRYLYDKLSIHIRGLINLGVTSETNATLVPVIMGKLPSDIRIQVARITRRAIWSLGELLELLENEVEAREMGESIKITEDRSSYIPKKPFVKNTAATLCTDTVKSKTNISSVYCNRSHFSASCEHVKDVKSRRDILNKRDDVLFVYVKAIEC